MQSVLQYPCDFVVLHAVHYHYCKVCATTTSAIQSSQ
jgi:hypothetical protein